uniref:Tetraspanin n=1 Tax=Hanusia phi TaxID=3032 RepID=A0A7S0EAD4_9CRYP|mmetsp:Transcript_19051/g.43693  ORF Transcript_19051/g.43693 Transcript_19051/m.43693 type:complete len:370 (+) Transcript_19051:157-1266(+)
MHANSSMDVEMTSAHLTSRDMEITLNHINIDSLGHQPTTTTESHVRSRGSYTQHSDEKEGAEGVDAKGQERASHTDSRPRRSRLCWALVFLGADAVLVFLVGCIFLGIGVISMRKGQHMSSKLRLALNTYCAQECSDPSCEGTSFCSQISPACDCLTGRSNIPSYFFAPSSVLIVLGVLSMVTSGLGFMGAISRRPSWLCGYVLAVCFVVIMQILAFATAVMLLKRLDKVPKDLLRVLDQEYQDFNWMYLQDFIPHACVAANTTSSNNTIVYHPACSWNNTCIPSLNGRIGLDCCLPSGMCDVSKTSQCTTTSKCLHAFVGDAGSPVFIATVVTLFLETLSIVCAWVIRRETVKLKQHAMSVLPKADEV